MDAKYDADQLRETAKFALVADATVDMTIRPSVMLSLLHDLATLQHENESWRLIDEQNHRDLERYEKALKRVAEMDYACDDKNCAAPDVANEALSPSKD